MYIHSANYTMNNNHLCNYTRNKQFQWMCNNKTNIYLCSAQTASCTVVCAGCSSSKISDFSPRDYRNLKESQQQCYRDETNLPLSLFVVRFLLIFFWGGAQFNYTQNTRDKASQGRVIYIAPYYKQRQNNNTNKCDKSTSKFKGAVGKKSFCFFCPSDADCPSGRPPSHSVSFRRVGTVTQKSTFLTKSTFKISVINSCTPFT